MYGPCSEEMVFKSSVFETHYARWVRQSKSKSKLLRSCRCSCSRAAWSMVPSPSVLSNLMFLMTHAHAHGRQPNMTVTSTSPVSSQLSGVSITVPNVAHNLSLHSGSTENRNLPRFQIFTVLPQSRLHLTNARAPSPLPRYVKAMHRDVLCRRLGRHRVVLRDTEQPDST